MLQDSRLRRRGQAVVEGGGRPDDGEDGDTFLGLVWVRREEGGCKAGQARAAM